MDREEFITKARELGMSEEYIADVVADYDERQKAGAPQIPLEAMLEVPPTTYP